MSEWEGDCLEGRDLFVSRFTRYVMARHEMYSKTFERDRETERERAKRCIFGILILGVLWRTVEQDGLLIVSLGRSFGFGSCLLIFAFWEARRDTLRLVHSTFSALLVFLCTTLDSISFL